MALSIGCSARPAFLIDLGVTARFTARPGWAARRALRGISSLEKKPIPASQLGNTIRPLPEYSYSAPRRLNRSTGRCPTGCPQLKPDRPRMKSGVVTRTTTRHGWRISQMSARRSLLPGASQGMIGQVPMPVSAGYLVGQARINHEGSEIGEEAPCVMADVGAWPSGHGT